jgi:hypothetical protein
MMRVDLVRFDHIMPNYPVLNLQETNVWPEQTRNLHRVLGDQDGKDLVMGSFLPKGMKYYG